ncbi:MAG: tetratricopeptide repeat protein [Myxococcota bacterium]
MVARPTVPSASVADSHPLGLLVVDGSEMTAPTCEQLLDKVPASTDKRWGFEHLTEARRALSRGDFDAAQRALCQAVRAKNAEVNIPFELAQLLLLRRDTTAAAHWANEAARLDPRAPRILNALGDALVRTGNLEDARAAWLAASNLTGSDPAASDRFAQQMLTDAEGALRERDPARAERLLRRVVAFRPHSAAAHAKLGIALHRLGFRKSAELWSQRSVELASVGAVPNQ